MDNSRVPPVSIGMPVYNGAAFLRGALDSLLAQDFADFELVISDNASTDDTPGICLEYAARDSRIRYCRNNENIGAVRNLRRVLELSRGDFFMWAAHDDLWDPAYLSACYQALQNNPKAVLCATSAILLDHQGQVWGDPYCEDIDTVGLDQMARLEKVLMGIARNTSFYGLYRRETIQRIPLKMCYGFDHVFMAELSLYGEFIRLPEFYFYSRIGGAGNSTGGIMRTLQIRSRFMAYLPNLSFLMSFLRSALTWQELSLLKRLKAARLVIKRFSSPPYPERIAGDIRYFAQVVKYRSINWIKRKLSPIKHMILRH